MSKLVKVDVSSLTKREIFISICVIGLLFFVFGFVTWMNAILIPYFKLSFSLSNFQSYLVAFAFYISYFIMSIPASYLLKAVGFKKGMMYGFWAIALGAFTFVPAALSGAYGLFLLGLFVIGVGLAVLQTAANPYITVLGPKERAAQRIGIMGICNKGAGILGPLLLAAIILRAIDADLFRQIPTMAAAEKAVVVKELLHRLILPYICMGLVLIGLGLIVWISPLPEINTEQESKELAMANSGKKSILEFPHLILGAIAIFLHVGTHVTAIDSVINYATSMGIPLTEAKVFPSYTLLATMFGYLLGIIVIPKLISQLNVFRFCTILGLTFTLLILLLHRSVTFLGHTTDVSIWFVVLLGFANSMIWAGIWPLALDGLGRFTKLGSSILIMGLCGNAILPLCYGYFADRYDLKVAYGVLIPCFLYLAFYAFYGYRIRSWSFK